MLAFAICVCMVGALGLVALRRATLVAAIQSKTGFPLSDWLEAQFRSPEGYLGEALLVQMATLTQLGLMFWAAVHVFFVDAGSFYCWTGFLLATTDVLLYVWRLEVTSTTTAATATATTTTTTTTTRTKEGNDSQEDGGDQRRNRILQAAPYFAFWVSLTLVAPTETAFSLPHRVCLAAMVFCNAKTRFERWGSQGRTEVRTFDATNYERTWLSARAVVFAIAALCTAILSSLPWSVVGSHVWLLATAISFIDRTQVRNEGAALAAWAKAVGTRLVMGLRRSIQRRSDQNAGNAAKDRIGKFGKNDAEGNDDSVDIEDNDDNENNEAKQDNQDNQDKDDDTSDGNAFEDAVENTVVTNGGSGGGEGEQDKATNMGHVKVH